MVVRALHFSAWCPCAIALFLLAGCSRSVEWDEEVPLNTGETIWVHRSGTYSFKSQAGNPLVFAYRRDRTTQIAFTYRQRKYAYTTDAELQVLAIAPDGTPNLVSAADDYSWQWQHDYRCPRPSYVQFRPDASGEVWAWPPKVEPWLHGLRTNLTFGIPPLDSKSVRMTIDDRTARNVHAFLVGPQFKRIDPSYQSGNCKSTN